MAIETVDFPIDSMVIFHSYVANQSWLPRKFTMQPDDWSNNEPAARLVLDRSGVSFSQLRLMNRRLPSGKLT